MSFTRQVVAALVLGWALMGIGEAEDSGFEAFKRREREQLEHFRKTGSTVLPAQDELDGKVLFFSEPAAKAAQPSAADMQKAARARQCYDEYKALQAEIPALEQEAKTLYRKLYPTDRKKVDPLLWGVTDLERSRRLKGIPALIEQNKGKLAAIKQRWDKEFDVLFGPSAALDQTIAVDYLDNTTRPGVIRTKILNKAEYHLGFYEKHNQPAGPAGVPEPPGEPGDTPPPVDAPDKVEPPVPPVAEPPPAPDEPPVRTPPPAPPGRTVVENPEEEDEEEDEFVGVAPSLTQTKWKGEVVIDREQMLNENDELVTFELNPKLRSELTLSIDGGNRASGTFIIENPARALRLNETKGPVLFTLDGHYNSTAGSFDLPAEGHMKVPSEGANIGGVPMVFEVLANVQLSGRPDSDSEVGGKVAGSFTLQLRPSRPVTDADIAADAMRQAPPEWREFGTGEDKRTVDVNAEARAVLIKETRKVRDEKTEPEVYDRAKVFGTWRASKQP